jgi:hypothetical protein
MSAREVATMNELPTQSVCAAHQISCPTCKQQDDSMLTLPSFHDCFGVSFKIALECPETDFI